MVKRTKLVNDIVDLIPILHLLSTETYKRVYSALLEKWYTIEELKREFGENFIDALRILKHAGMLEVRWRMPADPSNRPEKEYHVNYTHISANFYVSLKELNSVLEIAFMPDDELEKYVSLIEAEINAGRNSVAHICKSLNLDPLLIRSVAKRSLKLMLKGQIVELAKNDEI